MYTDVNFILSVGTVPVFSLSRTCAKLCTAVHVFVNLCQSLLSVEYKRIAYTVCKALTMFHFKS